MTVLVKSGEQIGNNLMNDVRIESDYTSGLKPIFIDPQFLLILVIYESESEDYRIFRVNRRYYYIAICFCFM